MDVQGNVASLVEARKLTDEAVAARVRAGETELFEILIRRHDQQLFRAARAILGNDAEAEDALQQSWLLAYSKLEQFLGQSRLSTWLTRIVINEALGRRPRLRLLEEAETIATAEESPSSAPSPEAIAEVAEMARLLEKAIDQLPEHYRLVFVLREVQGLTTAETAECLQVSEDVVKVRLHRAKGRLRRILVVQLDASAPTAWPFLGARCERMVDRVMSAIPGSSAS